MRLSVICFVILFKYCIKYNKIEFKLNLDNNYYSLFKALIYKSFVSKIYKSLFSCTENKVELKLNHCAGEGPHLWSSGKYIDTSSTKILDVSDVSLLPVPEKTNFFLTFLTLRVWKKN